MNGDLILAIVLALLLIYGFWCGWKQLTNGSGLLGGHLPQKAIVWINQKKAGPIVVKAGISLVLAYIFVAMGILLIFITYISHMLRQSQ